MHKFNKCSLKLGWKDKLVDTWGLISAKSSFPKPCRNYQKVNPRTSDKIGDLLTQHLKMSSCRLSANLNKRTLIKNNQMDSLSKTGNLDFLFRIKIESELSKIKNDIFFCTFFSTSQILLKIPTQGDEVWINEVKKTLFNVLNFILWN